jgi:hypothetical protein
MFCAGHVGQRCGRIGKNRRYEVRLNEPWLCNAIKIKAFRGVARQRVCEMPSDVPRRETDDGKRSK